MTGGITLGLDGSTYSGSVAILDGYDVVAEGQLDGPSMPGSRGRDERFLPMVVACLAEAGVKPGAITRIVCGSGPGSFTSLRVAGSIAKGIARGAGCPMFEVSSLVLLAASMEPGRYLATLPAMRGEVFAAVVEVGNAVREVEATRIIPEREAGAVALRAGARLIPAESSPHAHAVAGLLEGVLAQGPVNLDRWEPVYGRLAEAQVRWEAAHGRPLAAPE